MSECLLFLWMVYLRIYTICGHTGSGMKWKVSLLDRAAATGGRQAGQLALAEHPTIHRHSSIRCARANASGRAPALEEDGVAENSVPQKIPLAL